MLNTQPRCRIKICGITRSADALEAARLGADALGFVFYAASPRNIDSNAAREIVAALPPFVTTVGLFVDADAKAIDAVLAKVRLDLLQFHGSESATFCAGFGVPYLKAVRMKPGLNLLQYAAAYASAAGILVDSYVEGVAGGTGTTFDWARIPRQLGKPLVLSGGLDPDNVNAAIATVGPWAVDVSSGVEAAKGIKDSAKMARFIQGVRDATA